MKIWSILNSLITQIFRSREVMQKRPSSAPPSAGLASPTRSSNVEPSASATSTRRPAFHRPYFSIPTPGAATSAAGL